MTGAGSVDLVDVTKRYGGTIAVAGLSLAVESGEFVTLLGPSGCGKSTTLRMIGGFERPNGGEISIGGVAMAGRPPHVRPVNTVFQNYALFPHLTVGQNVAFGLEMTSVPGGERRSRVDAALAMVRLPGITDRVPGDLSGGQQQRVALARALVNRPAVLLLDEPLGALDLKLRHEMQGELRTLNRETGATFIYVTHDQDEALTMSDRIAVMYQGRIAQAGSPAEIYERPRSRFVADFVGKTNLLRGSLREVRDRVGTVAVAGVGTVAATMLDGIAPPIGTEVSVSVRPEKVRIGTAATDTGSMSRVSGRLVEIRYGGAQSQIVVEVADGLRLLAHTPADGRDLSAVSGGSPVTLSFRAADAWVLED